MAMYIGGNNFSAHSMRSMSLSEVNEYFRIPLVEETKINEFMSAPKLGPLSPLVKFLQKALNETGEVLFTYGYENFSALVFSTLNSGAPKAADLVSKLVKLFPAFNDTAEYKSNTVKIIKKAQLLACDLYRALKDKDPRFVFEDIGNLTVFSDNVLPAVLRKFGVLTLSDHLAKIVDSQEILPRGDEEVELRLCAVYACDLIVAEAREKGNQDLNAAKLDYYLWLKGKDEQEGFRQIERHYTQDTYYY